MFLPDDYIRRTSSTIPFGYELDENFDGYLKPITEELQILNNRLVINNKFIVCTKIVFLI